MTHRLVICFKFKVRYGSCCNFCINFGCHGTYSSFILSSLPCLALMHCIAKTTVTTPDEVKSPVSGSPSSHQGFLGAISHDIHKTSQVASISGLDALLHDQLKCLEYVKKTHCYIADIRTVRKNERKQLHPFV